MKRPVVKRAEIPAYAPISLSISLWLLLDRFAAPGWMWGVVGCFVALLWLAFLHHLWTSVELSAFSAGSIAKAREIRDQNVVEEMTKP